MLVSLVMCLRMYANTSADVFVKYTVEYHLMEVSVKQVEEVVTCL